MRENGSTGGREYGSTRVREGVRKYVREYNSTGDVGREYGSTRVREGVREGVREYGREYGRE